MVRPLVHDLLYIIVDLIQHLFGVPADAGAEGDDDVDDDNAPREKRTSHTKFL